MQHQGHKNRFFSLLKLAASAPLIAWQNFTYDRVRRLVIAISQGDRNFIEDIFRNYIPLLSTYKQRREALKLADEESDDLSPVIIPQAANVMISIIIYSYNSWNKTRRCLKTIINTIDNIDYEIILADDCSRDVTKEEVKKIEGLNVFRNSTDLGYLRTLNKAAQKARGQYIVFMLNSILTEKEWLKHLLIVLEEDSSIGMISPKVIFPNGKLQQAGNIVWSDGRYKRYGHMQDAEMSEYNYTKEVDFPAGSCFMVRKACWDEVGGFDSRYSPTYYEDVDLSFRFRESGLKVFYEPKSIVIQKDENGYGAQNRYDLCNYLEINRRKFLNKWHKILEVEYCLEDKGIFKSRDRSKKKKTILVIDHYVPQFDRDAGSKSTFQYLKLLAKMDFNVKFMGDNFFKHEPYTSCLQRLGIEVLYGSYYQEHWENWIIKNGSQIDYIYMHRPHISIKYIPFCRKYSPAKILYQCHDLHFLRSEEQYKITKEEKYLKNAKHWKKIEEDIFQSVDVVLTFSHKELSLLQTIYPDVNFCQIPLYIYETFPDFNYDPDNRKDLFFVGGFNHPPNVDGILWFVNDVFPQIRAKFQCLKFVIAGSNAPREIKNLQSEHIQVLGYVTDVQLEKLYTSAKLVVVPLQYGAGVKGKVVEAMYYGVPVVTTEYGIEGIPGLEQLIKPTNQPEDILDQVTKLLTNKDKSSEISLGYRQFLQSNFSERAAKDALNAAMSV